MGTGGDPENAWITMSDMWTSCAIKPQRIINDIMKIRKAFDKIIEADGARHSRRVSGAVFNLILGLRYQSVLGCVPKCPDFARPVECPDAKCPIFARNSA